MQNNTPARAVLVALAALVLAACGRTVAGTYAVIEGPVKDITVTLGSKTFAFSSGASGTYEVSGDRVIFSGATFNGTMKIDGRDLANETWRFARRD